MNPYDKTFANYFGLILGWGICLLGIINGKPLVFFVAAIWCAIPTLISYLRYCSKRMCLAASVAGLWGGLADFAFGRPGWEDAIAGIAIGAFWFVLYYWYLNWPSVEGEESWRKL